MERFFRDDKGAVAVRVEPKPGHPDQLELTLDDETLIVTVQHRDGAHLRLGTGDAVIAGSVAREEDRRFVQGPLGAVLRFERVRSIAAAQHGHDAESTLTASTPAQVVQVLVQPGDEVGHGDTLVVLEAMKMEFKITAPRDGRIQAVSCSPSEVVAQGQVLVTLEEPAVETE